MKFYYKDREFDTDKYVYVLFQYHKDTYHGGEWLHAIHYGMNDYIMNPTNYPIKCKRGTIKNIEIDFNNGQSFVTNFEVEIKGYEYTINAQKNFIAHNTKEPRELYYKALAEGKI